ncbi:DUF4365 domain-containing protein [Flavobacterium sp. LHD-85]|uniref:DUF4365 domain-containing protein n=1 Tax=Flavobacterium sp. LHD-85 TaxID=3071410 RepID=UPI0027E2164B|nr:DUF4365 domain-containing protein [Flavobacterium sp. LHD-85]MDQ6530296.1 DUF4365 domain-containing protein [Flavobacterium sp. LHD-85]
MTEEQIKEQLSNRFIGILAANKGFAVDKPEIDLGIDYTLKKSYQYTKPDGTLRWNFDSRYIDIQLKATTENSIIYEANSIKYDLEVKSYNDLIERQTNGTAPLVLILFVLPVNSNLWVDINNNEIRLRKNAYWYIPPTGSGWTSNTSRIRIEIPNTNLLGINFCNDLHSLFYP